MDSQHRAPARITVHLHPHAIEGNSAAFVDLLVENTSVDTWELDEAYPVRLSYHWLDAGDTTVVFDGVRTFFPQPIAPNTQYRLNMRIHPPPAPGCYTLIIDLVREGIGWFGLQNRVEIECRPASGRKVVLVNGNCLAGDAVGNNLTRKLRLLQRRGFVPLLLTGNFDRRLPLDVQAHMVEVAVEDILDPPADVQWAATHFQEAELWIVDYSNYYPLVELLKYVPSGPVLFDYHGVTPPELWANSVGMADVELGVKNIGMVAYADHAIAHSEYMRDELTETGMIDREHTHVLPYAVPVEIFRPASLDDGLSALQLDGGPVLLYVGRMAGNKRIDRLIRMAALVKERYPQVRLLLVGENSNEIYGDIIAEAHRLIGELDLENNVIFTGPKSHNELAAYYNACDVYVTASLHEGFCIPVIEAMACGKPVVASAATALPWTVGDAGLLFPPDDIATFAAQVRELLDSRRASDEHGGDSLYWRLSRRGVERAQEFTEERYEERFDQLIQRILCERPARNGIPAQTRKLEGLATTSRPNYRVHSPLPVIGRLIAWVRIQLTSHLREPYLEPIFARQDMFNRATHQQLAALTRLFRRNMRALEKKVAAIDMGAQQAELEQLKARVAELEAKLADHQRVQDQDGVLSHR